jgi:hyperosmotically inducible protein
MKKPLVLLTVIGGALALPALGAEPNGKPRDAWIQGKIETVFALNRHLDGFAIDTDVVDGTVRLTGRVESDIDRDLAAELAKGIEGVVSVDNDLVVEGDSRADRADADTDRPLSVWVDDATTTAAVKTKLLANANTDGLEIDVDTRGDVVTLSGEVESTEEKQLAEQLARNTDDVKDVRNQLVVRADD